jgi:uncharacterized protein YndB with AHSA1/START domain
MNRTALPSPLDHRSALPAPARRTDLSAPDRRPALPALDRRPALPALALLLACGLAAASAAKAPATAGQAVPAAAQAAGTPGQAAAGAPPAAQAGPAAGNDRFTMGDVQVVATRVPEKRLDMETVVPASLDQVWEAFTTSDGLVTWLTPGATVELRLGGPWQANFPGGKTGGGTILAFLPREMLAVAALAPEAFPTVRRERTQAVFRFDAIDATHTRVRLAQIGWQTGDEWDRAFTYLAKGNAQLLNALVHRFKVGPIDWKALFAAQPPPPSAHR